MKLGIFLVMIALALALPSSLRARAWNEINPGVTKKPEVLAKFGTPTKDVNRGGELTRGILYQSKQAIEGTKQTQFFFDEVDTVTQVHVFPKTEVKKEQIVKTYGTDYEEKLTDSFKVFFNYRREGLVVYFQEGNEAVASLIFLKPTP